MSKREIKSVCQELLTEELIGKISSEIAKKMEVLFDAKLDKLLDGVNKSLNSVIETVKSNEVRVNELQKKYDYLDQHVKRNTLRFHGILDDDHSQENLLDTVLKVINDKLNITCEERDIENVFRVGKYDADSARPRTIVVNFSNGIIRTKIFNARKLLKKSGMSIFEDLTKIRYDLLLAAKRKLGMQHAWSAGGKIYVWCSKLNKKCEIVCEDDLLLY